MPWACTLLEFPHYESIQTLGDIILTHLQSLPTDNDDV